MLQLLHSPSCILVGVAAVFLILVATLPPAHAFGLVVGTAVAVGLVVARLHREAVDRRPMGRQVGVKV